MQLYSLSPHSLCLIQPPPACTAPATYEKLGHGEDFEGGAKIREEPDLFGYVRKISLTWKTSFFVPNGFKSLYLTWVQSFSCSNSTSTIRDNELSPSLGINCGLLPAFLCWLMPLFMAVLATGIQKTTTNRQAHGI